MQKNKVCGNLILKKNTTVYTSKIKLNLSSIVPCLSGPKRPQDKIELPNVANHSIIVLKKIFKHCFKSRISK